MTTTTVPAQQTQTAEAAATMLQVFTTRQSVKAPQLCVTATARKTKNGPEIPAEHRSRSIVIPEFAPTGVPSKFHQHVITLLTNAAREQLAALWAKNPELREVQAASFTEDGILAYLSAEAESRKLSADKIASELAAFFATIAEDRREAAKTILCSFAGTKHQGGIKQLESLHSKVSDWHDTQDEESTIVSSLLTKMQKRIDELRADADAEAF